MTAWTQNVWLGFDTETTGVDVAGDRIVTAALVVREADGSPGQSRTWLADPGIEIPQAATAVHGITSEYAREHGVAPALALDEVAQVISGALASDAVLVAFNATYDLTILRAELVRHGLPTLEERLGREVLPVVDPLVVDRQVDRYRRGKRTLELMGQAYGVVENAAAHTADGDVAHTLAVLEALALRHAHVGEMTAVELHAAQAGWHAAWAENFEQFLRRKGREDVISRSWPVEPAA